MAGRKRKLLSLTAAAAAAAPDQQAANKHENQTDFKLKISPAKQKKPIHNVQSIEKEQSHYFTKTRPDLQHRLGEEFFKQPCISLAKAFLGKVMPFSVFLHIFKQSGRCLKAI